MVAKLCTGWRRSGPRSREIARIFCLQNQDCRVLQNKLCALNLDLDARDHKSADLTLSVTNIVDCKCPELILEWGILGFLPQQISSHLVSCSSVRG